jgi:hypothetical protein
MIRVMWNNESGTTAFLEYSYTFAGTLDYDISLVYGSASGTGQSDGYIRLYVNSALVGEQTDLNNYNRDCDNVRLGPSLINSWGSDVNQTITFDDFAIYDKD